MGEHGLKSLYLHTTEGIQSYIVTKTFNRNLYNIKHVIGHDEMYDLSESTL
jgi:hypothetical protein